MDNTSEKFLIEGERQVACLMLATLKENLKLPGDISNRHSLYYITEYGEKYEVTILATIKKV